MLEGMGEELTCVGVDAGGDGGGTHLCRGRCWRGWGEELTCVGVDAGGDGGGTHLCRGRCWRRWGRNSLV